MTTGASFEGCEVEVVGQVGGRGDEVGGWDGSVRPYGEGEVIHFSFMV